MGPWGSDSVAPVAPGDFSLQKLEVFRTVVERGGVGRAAEELHVSQPVVSAHIRSLETRLNTKLFARQGRKLILTEAGELTYRWANEIFRSRVSLARSLESVANGTAGHASIGSSLSIGSYIVAPALIRFKQQVPDAMVELRLGSVEATLESLRDGTADFCIIPTQEVLNTRELDVESIGVAPFALLASAENTEIPASIHPCDLEQLPFVSPPSGWAIRKSQDSALLSLGVSRRRTTIELGSAEAIKLAVRANLGVALLWRGSATAELNRGELREITVIGACLTDTLYIVKRVNTKLSRLQQKLLDSLKSDIAAHLAQDAQ